MFSCSRYLIERRYSPGGQPECDRRKCDVMSGSPAPVYTLMRPGYMLRRWIFEMMQYIYDGTLVLET